MTPSNLTLRTLKNYVVLAAMLLLPACAETGLDSLFKGAPPTLKIGLIAPFEGLHRPLGYEALFSVKVAVQEQNVAGGLNGYRIELVALNDFDDPHEAQIQAEALLADPDVLGVVGHFSAAATQAATPIYQAADLAVSTPGLGGGDVSGAKDFVEDYQNLAGLSPGRQAVLTYEAANDLLAAIEQASRACDCLPTRPEVSAFITQK